MTLRDRPRIEVPLVALLFSLVISSVPGCTRAAEAPPQDERRAVTAEPVLEDMDAVTVVLPRGNADSGRQAFVDLKCTTCHRVAGETTFPAPVTTVQGPDLDDTLGIRPVSEVAAAIVVPSHSLSLRVSDETKKQLEGMLLSPMGDFSSTITVRQLADLLAYLRSR